MSIKRNLKWIVVLFAWLAFFQFCKKDVVDPPVIPDHWVYNPTSYSLAVPQGFPDPELQADNPLSEQGVELGRMLYYDKILDKDSARACANCHFQLNSFTSSGEVLPHVNLAWNHAFLWNGKVQGTVEDIMIFEVEEFFKTDMDRFRRHSTYPRLFYEAFGTSQFTSKEAAYALAQFIRTLIAGNSRFDKVQRHEIFFTEQESKGWEIFFTEKGDCFHCHGSILFSNNLFHNNGLDSVFTNYGLEDITGLQEDRGKFKTPTLRNIEFTGPYMHDGRYNSLEEVKQLSGLIPKP